MRGCSATRPERCGFRASRCRAEWSWRQRIRWPISTSPRPAPCAPRRLAPTLAEAHAGLGETHLVEGEDAREALAPLQRAHALLPANLEIRVALARAYAELGKRSEARDLLARVTLFSHPGPALDEALELLDELERAEDEQQSPARLPARDDRPAAIAPEATQVRTAPRSLDLPTA
jgi:thioredoxin-like negative regulator of GroEL